MNKELSTWIDDKLEELTIKAENPFTDDEIKKLSFDTAQYIILRIEKFGEHINDADRKTMRKIKELHGIT